MHAYDCSCEVDIAIEIHRELNGDESLMLCKLLEPLNILFFEDPIRSENIETLKEFTAKTIVPHVPVSVVNIAASLHLAAVIPNFLIMETFPPKTFKQALDSMGEYKFELKDGYMSIPSGPGWGIELVENPAEKNPYVTIPWRLDQYHCYGGADTTDSLNHK